MIANDCSLDAGCVAFNSNGWLKSSLEPEEDWETWTTDPCLGIYVKEVCTNQVPSGYKFYPLKDSPGLARGPFNNRNVPLIAEDCNADDGCLAFNSNGWLRVEVLPEEDWVMWTTDPCLGLYVKDRCPQVPDGYKFYPFKDTLGPAWGPFNYRNVPLIAEECNADAGCLAFNSNGWLKSQVDPEEDWETWTTDSCLGLYVKDGSRRLQVLSPRGLRGK